ncbi:MAG: aminotransferase class I/II-fold pyridoxal phosphate-dependent enzyme [bacterium]
MFNYLEQAWNIDPRLCQLGREVARQIQPTAEELRQLAAINQCRILRAFQEERVGESDFYPSTGYGYNDQGRDKLERIWAKIFGAEAALVRHQIVSGTHSIALCLQGILRPGDEFIAANGPPYDTLASVIGHKQVNPGSLKEFGISYKEVPPLPDNGEPDFEGIRKAINVKTRLVLIQRSRGYSWNPSLSLYQIQQIINVVKQTKQDIVCLVDNCYGEFTDTKEPNAVGADLVAGSLIKNPGGGLAPCGGYIAGKQLLIDLVASRLTAPGIGSEVGASLNLKTHLYQGLFLAPHVVGETLIGAVFTAKLLANIGFSVSPRANEKRHDIIQAIKFNNVAQLLAFCQGIQKASPVDSMINLEPAPMPGYEHKIVMACGSFVQGASIELSADAPIREPYIAYLQGGLTNTHVKVAIMIALQHMLDRGKLQLEKKYFFNEK